MGKIEDEDAWRIETLRRLREAVERKEVVVFDQLSRRGQEILAGFTQGMTLREAFDELARRGLVSEEVADEVARLVLEAEEAEDTCQN